MPYLLRMLRSILSAMVLLPAVMQPPARGELSFDFNGDGSVDLDDYRILQSCLVRSGPGEPAGLLCMAVGMDADGDVDLIEVAGFQNGFTGGPVCGNGVVEGGEECDDGNTNRGDCCSATCQIETAIPNDCCSLPIAVTDGTRSYSNSGATTDGPDEPTMCDFFGRTNVESDIWYCYTASCTGTAAVGLCGSSYDTKLAVYGGCDCPTAAPLACSDDDCGTAVSIVQSRVTFAATSGQEYLLRVGGYLGQQGDGRLTIGCNVDACANGSGNCFVASPTDASGCGDATCCGKTCDLDRFCCDVTWDATCAGEAQGVCMGSFAACAPGAGVCNLPDTTPGCDNVSCCNTVCMSDPVCCLSAWDSTCVEEANSVCFLTCGPGAGDCHAVHTTPGCDPDACCQAVCTEDPFCCDTNWDQMCVDVAAASPSCP